MIRTVLSIALFILLIVGCIWVYTIVRHESVPGGGDVLVRSSPEHDQMEAGTTYIGDKPLEAHPTPSRSDTPGTINTEPVADYGKSADATADTTQYDLRGRPTNPSARSFNPQPSGSNFTTQPNSATPYTQASLSNDTIAPNPPNGLAFAGTGPYQWYRQGDLTWRVDSKSGASCIDYATMEEWNKPLVYSHGCGGRSWRRHHVRN